MILITGAAGVCGSLLQKHFTDARYTDIKDFDFKDRGEGREKIIGDLSDSCFCESVLHGVSTLVHLGGQSDPKAEWEKVFKANMIVVDLLFNMAIEKGVSKIIFASTNHVVGQVELNNMPEIYTPGKDIYITSDYPVCPDSYYGVSKCFGEALLSYLAYKNKIAAISLRLGAVLPPDEDTDYAYANRYRKSVGPNSKKEKELVDRLSCLRVSNERWVGAIEYYVHKEWAGHKIRNLSGNRYTWLENEV